MDKIELIEGLAASIYLSAKGRHGVKVADYIDKPIWNQNIELIKDLKPNDMLNLRDDYVRKWIW
jgi:hypothetical protein